MDNASNSGSNGDKVETTRSGRRKGREIAALKARIVELEAGVEFVKCFARPLRTCPRCREVSEEWGGQAMCHEHAAFIATSLLELIAGEKSSAMKDASRMKAIRRLRGKREECRDDLAR